MSWIDSAKDQLSNHATLLHVFELIGGVVKRALVDRDLDPIHVLQVIERTYDKIKVGFTGKLDRAEVEKHLDELLEQLAQNDAAADAALDAKFPQGES